VPRRYHGALLAFCLLLTSCTQLPQIPTDSLDWEVHAAQLAALHNWTATGKLALRTETQSESANMQWTQKGKTTQILLSGPMGLGATSIESDQRQLQISRNGQTQYYALSDLAAGAVEPGWDLPLQALPYWILGLPSPQPTVQAQEVKTGLLRRLEQLGWTVIYEDYRQFGHLILPTRIKMERDSTRAQLIIRNWSGFSS